MITIACLASSRSKNGIFAMTSGTIRTLKTKSLVIIALCAILFAFGQFHRAAGGVLSPYLADDFGLSASVLGVVIASMFIGTMIAQIPAGAALDYYGVHVVLPIFVLITAIGCLLFAAAGDAQSVMVSRIVLGVGLSAAGAGTYIIVAHLVSNQHFGLVNGLIVSLGGIGGLLGTYPLAQAIEKFGWRGVYVGAGAATAVFSIVLFLVLWRNRPPGDTTGESVEGQLSIFDGYKEILSNIDFLRILALGFVTFAPITTITGLWGGPFFEDVFDLGRNQIGGVLFLLFASTIFAGFVFGPLDAIVASRKKLILTAATVSMCSLVGLAVFSNHSSFVATALLLTMTFSQQFYIPLGAHLQRLFPNRLLGRASAIFSFISVAGIPVMQSLFGVALDLARAVGVDPNESYRLGFAYMAACILIGIAIYARTDGSSGCRKLDVRKDSMLRDA